MYSVSGPRATVWSRSFLVRPMQFHPAVILNHYIGFLVLCYCEEFVLQCQWRLESTSNCYYNYDYFNYS